MLNRAFYHEGLSNNIEYKTLFLNENSFRKIDSQLVRQLKPYLILDADYIRAIADHIAMMTDVSAEQEMIALYGH